MLQAYRVQTGDASKSYEHLYKALGTPKSAVPDTPSGALDEAGWWLYGLKRAGSAGRPAVLRQFPPLAAGIQAETARESTDFTEYDGYVPAAGRVLNPGRRDTPVSPTELEGAAKCPFRYFLEKGLGIDALEDEERDHDVWLDPATRGLLLHDLYARLLRRCRDGNGKPHVPEDVAWLIGEARGDLETLRREMPPPSDEVFEREVRDLEADLQLFVEAERDRERTRIPVGLEVSFGKVRDENQSEPLASDEPVVIDLGGGLRFRLVGRIDRIDQIGPDSFEIVDYKTGGFFPDDWKGTFHGGRLLQHALYGVAATELLRRKYTRPVISGGAYYFSSAKGEQERVFKRMPSRAAVTAVLRDLTEVIGSGLFVHAPDDSACTFCRLGAACGARARDRAEPKIETDRLLEVYRRLVAHA
jgi:ATP-dependent helicase/nuclease subunit B